jgi:putative membrane protein
MKHALKAILVNSIAITLTAMVLPGIDYNNSLSTLIVTAAVLGIASTFIRPALSLILLPINVITLGIAGLFLNALILFITTLLVQNFNIITFTLVFNNTPIFIPLFWSYVICAAALGFVASILRKIVNA